MELSHKERWLLSIQNKPVDRLVFWPKIYNQSYAAAQAPPFSGMSIRQLHDYAGTDIHQMIAPCVRLDRGDCAYEETRRDGLLLTRYVTPVGTLEGVQRYDAATDSYHPEKQVVETGEDIKTLTRFFAATTPVFDEAMFAESKAAYAGLGQRGIAAETLSESPLMDFIEWYAGIENGHFLLMDFEDEAEELFAEMHRVNMETTRIACTHSVADVLYFIENTSTTIISPGQFEAHCHRHLTDYATIARDAGRTLLYHMCGHLEKVLPMLADIPFAGIEALSSPPIGNTTFAQARQALPGKALIGGTNCLTWLKTPQEIIEEIEGYLDELPHWRGIMLGTGGIIPPACTPETLKTVFEHVSALPMR